MGLLQPDLCCRVVARSIEQAAQLVTGLGILDKRDPLSVTSVQRVLSACLLSYRNSLVTSCALILPCIFEDVLCAVLKSWGKLQRTDLGADCMRAAQNLLGKGIVVHACILATHAQQRLVQPWEEPGCCPIGCHRLQSAPTLSVL